jgi:hypothetical protein
MFLKAFPRDIKVIIAQYSDEHVWYQLYRVDEQFTDYAKTEEGCRKFIELFTKRIQYFNTFETRLFGKLHSIYDQPARVNFVIVSCEEWYYQDQRHRDNGNPAIINEVGNKEYWENGKFVAYEYKFHN